MVAMISGNDVGREEKGALLSEIPAEVDGDTDVAPDSLRVARQTLVTGLVALCVIIFVAIAAVGYWTWVNFR